MLDELDRAELGDLIRKALLDHDQHAGSVCQVELRAFLRCRLTYSIEYLLISVFLAVLRF
jgi:hypothetical protein